MAILSQLTSRNQFVTRQQSGTLWPTEKLSHWTFADLTESCSSASPAEFLDMPDRGRPGPQPTGTEANKAVAQSDLVHLKM
jgi:hypothetical protein